MSIGDGYPTIVGIGAASWTTAGSLNEASGAGHPELFRQQYAADMNRVQKERDDYAADMAVRRDREMREHALSYALQMAHSRPMDAPKVVDAARSFYEFLIGGQTPDVPKTNYPELCGDTKYVGDRFPARALRVARGEEVGE